MKIEEIIIIALSAIFIKTPNHQAMQVTKIFRTSAELIFEPIGKIIPKILWAYTRVSFNITNMFTGTNNLCKANNLVRMEVKKIFPEDNEQFNHGLMIPMTNNLKRNCLENTYIIDAVADVFALHT